MIRRARMAHGPLPFPVIKRHRKGGPVLSALGIVGFCIGFTLVMLDSGKVLQFPLHFVVGCVIVFCLIATFIISRKIKGPDSPYRTPHFYLGIAILCLYLINVVLGLGVLL
jgi:cytochrome b561